MTAQRSAHEKPFRLEEATIEELHAAITVGADHLRRDRAALSRPRPRL